MCLLNKNWLIHERIKEQENLYRLQKYHFPNKTFDRTSGEIVKEIESSEGSHIGKETEAVRVMQ